MPRRLTGVFAWPSRRLPSVNQSQPTSTTQARAVASTRPHACDHRTSKLSECPCVASARALFHTTNRVARGIATSRRGARIGPRLDSESPIDTLIARARVGIARRIVPGTKPRDEAGSARCERRRNLSEHEEDFSKGHGSGRVLPFESLKCSASGRAKVVRRGTGRVDPNAAHHASATQTSKQ